MSNLLDEDSWEDLLTLVEEGKVIPVVGDGVIVTAEGERLSTWLAGQLAKKLGVAPEQLPQNRPPTLNDVVCRHLLNRGDRTDIYLRLHRILRDSCPEPGPAVRALASIRDFNLYLSTTFDPLLERALKANPRNLATRFELARTLYGAGAVSRATQEIGAVLNEAPHWAPALILAGDIERLKGDNSRAQSRYREALAISPAPALSPIARWRLDEIDKP